MSSHPGREVNYNRSSVQSSALIQTLELLITSRDTLTNCWRIQWLHSLVMPSTDPSTSSKRTRSHSWVLDWLVKSLLPLLTVWVVVSSCGLGCDCCSPSPSSCHGSILCWQQRDGKRKTIRLGCHGQPTLQAPVQTCASQISCHLLIATNLYSSSLFVEWVPFDSCYSMCSKRNQAICLMLACFSFEVIIFYPNHLGCYSDIDFFLLRY